MNHARFQRRQRHLLMTFAVICTSLLMAACTTHGPTPEPYSTSGLPFSTQPRTKVPTAAQASDGGTAVIEHGMTIWENRQNGGPYEKSWVVTVENTSKTDMLLFVKVSIVWIYEGGDEDASPWSATDIRPGQTVAFGDQYRDQRRPTGLRVDTASLTWATVNTLQNIGFDSGVTVTSTTVKLPDAVDDRVSVKFTYDNHYAENYFRSGLFNSPPLDAVIVLRDSQSRLLGSWRLSEFWATGPTGDGRGDLSFDSWRDADPANSTVSIASYGAGFHSELFGDPLPTPTPS